MVAIIAWPCGLLRPQAVGVFLRPFSRSAGMSLTGNEQVLTSGASRWEVTIDLGQQFDRDIVRQFEVLVGQMQGRKNIASICICDPYKYGAKRAPLQQPWNDGTYFSDGTGWIAPSGGVQPLVVSAGCAAGATTITVGLTNPTRPAPEPGDYFSTSGWLYRVVSVTSGGIVTFHPAARRAIAAGVALATDPPRIYAHFADDDQGRRMRKFGRWGADLSLTFVEAFDR